MQVAVIAQYKTVCRGSPWNGVLRELFSDGLLRSSQVSNAKWIQVASGASIGSNANPNDLAFLPVWSKSFNVIVVYSDPSPLFFVLHIHKLGIDDEDIIVSDMIARLDSGDSSVVWSIGSFITGFEDVFWNSPAGSVFDIETDIEKDKVV
jgi:hypothetical protein